MISSRGRKLKRTKRFDDYIKSRNKKNQIKSTYASILISKGTPHFTYYLKGNDK